MLQAEAAKMLGVSTRQFQRWIKEDDFPDCSKEYDFPAIREWRSSRYRAGSEYSEEMKLAKLEIEQAKARITAVEAEKKHYEWEAKKGNYFLRDEHELAVKEMVTIFRDSVLRLPKELCSFVSDKEIQARLVNEGDEIIRTALGELHKRIERLGEDGAVD